MEPLRPVEKQTLVTVVLERLVTYIQGGALRPGDALPSQHELARQLSVSRPVLREAMQALATVGLIEIRPGSGCYVRESVHAVNPESILAAFAHDSVTEMLEARMVLEVELAALAAQRATTDDLSRIEATLGRIKRAAARNHGTSQATSDFHQAVARAAHNAVLLKMAQMLRRPQIAQGIQVEHALPDITAQEYENHRSLFEAISARDPELARRLMRDHLETAHGWAEELTALRSGAAASLSERVLAADA